SVSAMSGDQLSKKELFLKEITADAALYINNSAKSIIFCNIPKYYKITETKDIEILNEPLSDGNITIVERLDDFLNSKNKYEKNLKSGNAPEKVVGNAFCNLITNDNGIWQHESNYSYYYLANKNSISLGYLKFQIFPDHETNYFVNTISTVMPYFLPGIFSLKFDSSSLKQIDNLLNESSK
ncbi:MAG: hypothetical protein JXB50_15615, partial [Spirochaetes bacterium]|nr:hypothetical protein [Spirochaetota bacterium]